MPYASLTNIVKQQPLSTKPMRILHVVGGMDRGGTETWLMHVLRHIDRDRYQMDFLVYSDQHYAYTDEIHALGCQILSCPTPSKPWLFAANFKRVLQENAPYDIIHVQVHLFSGYVLHLARQAGIKARIVHSHIDTSSIESTANWRRKLYSMLMKWSIDKNSTAGLAASQIAAVDLFGSAYEHDSRWRTLYCGVDLAPFYAPTALRRAYAFENTNIRAQLGIPAEAIVVGHVGRFESQKNHQFVIEIAAELAKLEPNMRLVLIGVGSLRTSIEAKVIQMGLSEKVIFLGTRPDVPQLMTGLMDVFLFPSRYEGLGLVLVEAQAAGLPCIFADVVPQEADLVKPLLHRLSLSQPASDWAKVVLATRNQQCAISQSKALDLVSQTAFNIKISVQKLTDFYTSCCVVN